MFIGRTARLALQRGTPSRRTHAADDPEAVRRRSPRRQRRLSHRRRLQWAGRAAIRSPVHRACALRAGRLCDLDRGGTHGARRPRDVQPGRLLGRDDRRRAFSGHGDAQRHARHRALDRRRPCLGSPPQGRARPGLGVHVGRRGAGGPGLGGRSGRRLPSHRQSLRHHGRQRPAMRRRDVDRHGGRRHPGEVRNVRRALRRDRRP